MRLFIVARPSNGLADVFLDDIQAATVDATLVPKLEDFPPCPDGMADQVLTFPSNLFKKIAGVSCQTSASGQSLASESSCSPV